MARRILAAIEHLPAGDVRPLSGQERRRFRLRVGDWRVIYSCLGPDLVAIERIAHRREAYR